jgi:Tol biopolymer transport system component
LSRLSFEPNTKFGALWMPAGDEIVYSQDDPPYNIYRRSADGTGQPEALIASPIDNEPRSISPDGRVLIYSHSENETGYDLWTPGNALQRGFRVVLA